MNGITHKQAQRYLRMDLDGLLDEAQRLELETHLRACEACRLDSESFSRLTRRLQAELHSRWDLRQGGPSQNVLTNIHAKSRRIMMQKRIDLAFNIFGAILTLFVLFFVVSSVISELLRKSTAPNGTPTNIPASSSEERLIAFTSEQDGNPEIYTMRADGSNLTNLTNNPARDTNPVWSPNGKQIAFTSNRNDPDISQIYLMDADGSKVTLLTKEKVDHILPFGLNNKSGLWSADGSKLLYLQYRYDTDWNLQSIDVNHGNTIFLGTGRFDLNHISWSPDGRYVAYLKNDPQNTDENSYLPDLYIVNADGSNSREIKKLIPTDGRLFDYRWSKDGDNIILMGYKDDPFSIETIYEFNLDTNSLIQNFALPTGTIDWHDGISLIRPLAKETTFVWQHTDGTSNSLQWGAACSEYNFGRSSSGNFLISAVCPDQKSGFYWANSDGSIIKNLLTIGDMTQVPEWVWSPDDQYLATTVVTPQSTNLYILNVEASLENPSIQPVIVSVADKESFISIAWQPMIWEDLTKTQSTPAPEKNLSSGRLLAFTSQQDGNFEIYTVRAPGSDMKNLTNNPANDTSPVWSPDGTRIAFESDRDHSVDIYTMNADGSDLHQLTTNRGFDGFFQWSPDGQKIVYLSSQIGGDANIAQLYVMNADGSNRTVLLADRDSYIFLGWSPNGQKIVYQRQNHETNDPQDSEIHVMDIHGTNHYQWRAIVDEIKWIDDEHFVGHGWSGVSEPPSWKLYKFNASGGDPIEIMTIPSRIVALFNQTYLVEDVHTFAWYSMDGNAIPLKGQDFSVHCQKPGDRFLQETGHTISPDEMHAFVNVHCPEGTTWFYLENADGSQFVQLTDFSTNPEQVIDTTQWSPDGKFVTMTITGGAGGTADIYLFDIQKMLNDPATQPIQLTTDGAWKYGAVWQPNH